MKLKKCICGEEPVYFIDTNCDGKILGCKQCNIFVLEKYAKNIEHDWNRLIDFILETSYK